MVSYKITFENGSIIWLAASGIVQDFKPVPFGAPLEKGDVVLDPDKVKPMDILEYHDHRSGRIRSFDSKVVDVENSYS